MPFPLDEEFVLEAERQLGAKLPDSYRFAMIRSNGGEIEWHEEAWYLHPIADTSDRKRLSRTANHLLVETVLARKRRRFPSNGIAIADNVCGDKLLLLVESNGIGPAVHHWDHETAEITVAVADFAELDAGRERDELARRLRHRGPPRDA